MSEKRKPSSDASHRHCIQASETREEREARWRGQHKWDGPLVALEWGDVVSCSICGVDASMQSPCLEPERERIISQMLRNARLPPQLESGS